MNLISCQPCDCPTAQMACREFHYTRKSPSCLVARFAVYENGVFIGCVLFGKGGNRRAFDRFDLTHEQGCELVRVALTDHVAPVSQIVAQCLRELKKTNPKLRLVVSYADPKQGHNGGIYQALNFIYSGRSNAQRKLIVDGQFMHKCSAFSRWGTASPAKIREISDVPIEIDYGPVESKHAYWLPLDKVTRQKLKALSRPYPKTQTEVAN